MKHLLKIIAILIFTGSLYSQDLPGGLKKEDMQKKKPDDGKYTYFAIIGLNNPYYFEDLGWELTLGGSSLINEYFSIGASINYLISSNVSMESEVLDPNPILTMYYIDINLGTHLWFSNSLLASLSLDGGVGLANYSSSAAAGVPIDPVGEWFFLLEPNFDISFEIFEDNFLRLGVAYRQILGYELYDIDSADMSGIIFKLNLQSFD